MASKVHCTIVSPERPLFEGTAQRVIVPGVDGEIGILPLDAALIGALGPGVVRVHLGPEDGGKLETLAIRGGFVHVKDDVVTLLVTDAVQPQDVDREKLRADLDATLEALQHPGTDEEFQELLTLRRWCEVRLALLG